MICGQKVNFLENLEFWWESEIAQILKISKNFKYCGIFSYKTDQICNL